MQVMVYNSFMVLLTRLKHRWLLFPLVGVACLIIMVVIFFLQEKPQGGVGGPTSSPEVPPVIINSPELTVLSVDPPTGERQSVDGFTPTAFKFSAPIAPELINIIVTPTIQLNKTVYPEKPDTLFVEPAKSAWVDGTTYTLTVKIGSRGSNGEELKEDYTYIFSNTQPVYIDLPGPI